MGDPRRDPNGFTVTWPTPAPLRGAVDADRLEYWRHAGASAAHLKDRELARGLDKDGRRLKAISESTRRNRRSAMGIADPGAPPLMPAYSLSRTRWLLRHRAYVDRVVFWWDFDSHAGRPWGEILDYHRKGQCGPVRDVIGLSAASTAQARRDADRWLAGKVAGKPESVFDPAKDRGGPLVRTPPPPPRIAAPPPPPRVVVAPPKPPRAAFTSGPRRLVNGVREALNLGGMHVDHLSEYPIGGR